MYYCVGWPMPGRVHAFPPERSTVVRGDRLTDVLPGFHPDWHGHLAGLNNNGQKKDPGPEESGASHLLGTATSQFLEDTCVDRPVKLHRVRCGNSKASHPTAACRSQTGPPPRSLASQTAFPDVHPWLKKQHPPTHDPSLPSVSSVFSVVPSNPKPPHPQIRAHPWSSVVRKTSMPDRSGRISDLVPAAVDSLICPATQAIALRIRGHPSIADCHKSFPQINLRRQTSEIS